jgi:cell pole-organizing protein PopZ
MSDPVTNVEIEDVLASIRRLVADEPAEDKAVQPATAKTDALVLTPALRVADTATETPASKPKPTMTEQASNPVSAMPLTAPDPADTLEERVADLETAIAQTDDEWEPNDSEEDAFGDVSNSIDWQDTLGPQEENDDEQAIHAPQDNAADEAPYWEDAVPHEDPAAVTSLYQDTAEDDAAAAAEFVTAAEAILDETAAGIEDTLSAAVLDDLNQLDESNPSQASVLDEAMLRELVADIVRQELQGSLGERITRNVRKLVRREIQRALLSRDLS